jgi:hypothetical protein
MSRPLPVNMLLAGTGAVLLVSGIGGQPIGDVLRGSFGKIQFNAAAGSAQPGSTPNAAFTGEVGEVGPQAVSDSAAGTQFSGATVAPSPTTFTKWKTTKKQEAEGIAGLLARHGITNPTHAQIEQARREYHAG